MKKKAFTLIELLAVIIILAVIALIATPIILNVVNDAKEKAKIESANGIIDAANLYVNEAMLDSTKSTSGNIYDSIKANIKGEKPDSGEVYINELNQVAVALKYGNSCYKKDYNETTPKKVEDEECTLGEVALDDCVEYEQEIDTYDLNEEVCKNLVISMLEYPEAAANILCTGGDIDGETFDSMLRNSTTDVVEQVISYGVIENVTYKNRCIKTQYDLTATDASCFETIDYIVSYDIDYDKCVSVLQNEYDDSEAVPICRGEYAANDEDMNVLLDDATKRENLISSGAIYNVIMNSKKATITSYSCEDKQIIIPKMINGKTVFKIGTRSFNAKQLTSVIIPNSVKTIGDGAFANNQLARVTIGNSVTTIGAWVFINNQLTNVTISNSVEAIGWTAFAFNQLTSVTIGNSVTDIGGGAFMNNQLTSVTIPNSVKAIYNNAFLENQLTNVTIGNSVETIDEGAFANNPNLSSITIDKEKDSIDGEPWGADNATITYLK